jgi:hypothetical protein
MMKNAIALAIDIAFPIFLRLLSLLLSLKCLSSFFVTMWYLRSWSKPLYQSLSGEHACSDSNGGRVGQIHALQFVTGGVQMRFHSAKS